MKKYKKIPYAGSVMTPFPYFVDTDEEVAEVKRLMADHNISHIPVQQDGRVVGIVSDRDLFHLRDRSLPNIDKARIRAREIMADDPYIVAFETPLNEIALEMAKRHIGSAIVLHHKKLAGILSASDMCRILAEILEAEFSPDSGDDAA
jgi:acetoin utilization protein AcuB